MPPFARPPGHVHRLSQPYTRPPSTSNSTNPRHQTKSKSPHPRPNSPLVDATSVSAKKNKKRRKRDREKSATTSETLDGSSRLNIPTVPHVEDEKSIINRLMKVAAPNRIGEGGVVPSMKAMPGSPLLKTPSISTVSVPVKEDDGKLLALKKQLETAKEGAERVAAEMRSEMERLERRLESQKEAAGEQQKVRPRPPEFSDLGVGDRRGDKDEGYVERGGSV